MGIPFIVKVRYRVDISVWSSIRQQKRHTAKGLSPITFLRGKGTSDAVNSLILLRLEWHSKSSAIRTLNHELKSGLQCSGVGIETSSKRPVPRSSRATPEHCSRFHVVFESTRAATFMRETQTQIPIRLIPDNPGFRVYQQKKGELTKQHTLQRYSINQSDSESTNSRHDHFCRLCFFCLSSFANSSFGVYENVLSHGDVTWIEHVVTSATD